MRTATLVKMLGVLPMLPFLVGWTLWGHPLWWLAVLAGVLLYYPIHQLGQAIGYHKLFSHRAFTPRTWYPYLAAFIGSIAFYGDPLSAAMIHRIHHRYADTNKDPHSPVQGRLHAYIGWIVSYRPTAKDTMCVADLVRAYPWLIPFRKIEWLIPWTFHGALYWYSPFWSCAVLIACQLSIHNALAVNAFSHDPRAATADKSTDSVFLARWVNPTFLHRLHHAGGDQLDYSAYGVTDYWAKVIRAVLATPSTK